VSPRAKRGRPWFWGIYVWPLSVLQPGVSLISKTVLRNSPSQLLSKLRGSGVQTNCAATVPVKSWCGFWIERAALGDVCLAGGKAPTSHATYSTNIIYPTSHTSHKTQHEAKTASGETYKRFKTYTESLHTARLCRQPSLHAAHCKRVPFSPSPRFFVLPTLGPHPWQRWTRSCVRQRQPSLLLHRVHVRVSSEPRLLAGWLLG